MTSGSDPDVTLLAPTEDARSGQRGPARREARGCLGGERVDRQVRRWRWCVGAEDVERAGDRARERAEVVAALEDHAEGDAKVVGEPADRAGHRGVAVVSDLAAGERVI